MRSEWDDIDSHTVSVGFACAPVAEFEHGGVVLESETPLVSRLWLVPDDFDADVRARSWRAVAPNLLVEG